MSRNPKICILFYFYSYPLFSAAVVTNIHVIAPASATKLYIHDLNDVVFLTGGFEPCSTITCRTAHFI